ncbi:MAG: hypothetical protein H6742_12030 [Alphaproteobacteria bacterium]|nr:hypothetical protein [Alphaproteobacteria bacterium]
MPLSSVLIAAALSHPAAALRAPAQPETLCRAAELVVIAEVSGQEAQWSDGPLGGIETLSDLAVIETLYGQLPADPRVRSRGGRLDGLVQQVEDQPELQVDQRYLLLLVSTEQGLLQVVGGPDGMVPIATGPATPGLSRDAAVALLAGCRG